MVSAALIKLTSPVARSILVAISVALTIDVLLMIFAAFQYPYLIDYFSNELYVPKARTVAAIYSTFALVTLLMAISTAVATYKNATNYTLIHACLTAVFVPVSILVFFSASSSRYKPNDYLGDYVRMIQDYRINDKFLLQSKQNDLSVTDSPLASTVEPLLSLTFSTFVNLIDSLQTKFLCCGINSTQDWIDIWGGYIPPTCCTEQSRKVEPAWARQFDLGEDFEFNHCTEEKAYHLGCLLALKEDEMSKYAWLSDLIIFAIVMSVGNTMMSLLLFGIIKTEDNVYGNEQELSIVGVSDKPRPSQPTITNITHRPSVVQTLGGPTREEIRVRAQAVRFNISNSPRPSISGPSKFSAAARRGSSFI